MTESTAVQEERNPIEDHRTLRRVALEEEAKTLGATIAQDARKSMQRELSLRSKKHVSSYDAITPFETIEERSLFEAQLLLAFTTALAEAPA